MAKSPHPRPLQIERRHRLAYPSLPVQTLKNYPKRWMRSLRLWILIALALIFRKGRGTANEPLGEGILNPPNSIAGTTHNVTLRPVVTPPHRIRSNALVGASPHHNAPEGPMTAQKSETNAHTSVNREKEIAHIHNIRIALNTAIPLRGKKDNPLTECASISLRPFKRESNLLASLLRRFP